MSDLNDFCITGRLTRDAELKEVGANNTLLMKFAVANNTGWGTNEKVSFFECQLWGKRGESLKQYMTKGRQVALKGQLSANNWTGSDGIQHKDFVYDVTDVVLLAASQNKQEADNPMPEDNRGKPMTMEDMVF